MAAAVRPPGIGDARVPCPLCGGLIHPVAGRCKHCKEDLSTLRANRPQAAAVLPALNGRVPAPALLAGNGTSVHAAYAPPVAAAAVPMAIDPRDGSAPILPQRTTGRSMSAQRPGGSLLRNWPILVIILAMIAIVTAVVIMVLPNDSKGPGGKRQLMPAPAPDRMDTNPGGKQSNNTDPWANPDLGPDPRNSVPDPNAVPRVTPDPQRAPDPVDPDDFFGGLSFSWGSGSNNQMFLFSLANQACKKLKTCPNLDASSMTFACDQLAGMSLPPMPAGCPAADRCVAAIDKIDCDTTSTSVDPVNLVMLMQDCVKAATDC